MIRLLSMWRLVMGLLVAVLGCGFSSTSYGRDPVLFHVAKGNVVGSVAFSPNSESLVAACLGELSVWKTRPASEAERLVKRLRVPDSEDGADLPIAVSSNGTLVAVAVGGNGPTRDSRKAIQVWDIKKGVEVGTFVAGEHYRSHGYFIFAPNGTDMFIAVQKAVEVWSPITGKRRTIAGTASLEGYAVQHMRVLSDGSLVTARADGRICLWDTEKAALKSFRNVDNSIYSVAAAGGEVRKNYIVTSPDGKRAAEIDLVKPAVIVGNTIVQDASAGYSLTLWNLESGKPIRSLPLGAGKREADSVAWSDDGRFLAWVCYPISGVDQECVVWDVAQDKELMREKLPEDVSVNGVISFSSDTRMLAMPAAKGDDFGMVLMWDISRLSKEQSRAESKRKDAAK